MTWRNRLNRISTCYRLVLVGLALAPTAGWGGTSTRPRQGIVVMAHGGTPQWNAAVLAAVEPIRKQYPVEVAFGMADRESLQQAVAGLEAQGVREIAVVRLFVSGESFLEQTAYFLGLRPEPPSAFLVHGGAGDPHAGHPGTSHLASGPMQPRLVDSREHPIPPIQTQSRIILSREGLYDSPDMGRVIEERVRDLSRDPEREAVLILAHGEGSEEVNDRWLERLEELVEHIREAGFAAVEVETLREDWRDKRELAEARIREYIQGHEKDGNAVIVVPFRVFGFGPYEQVLQGLDYVADGRGLLPHEAVTHWIEQQAAQCFERTSVTAPSPR